MLVKAEVIKKGRRAEQNSGKASATARGADTGRTAFIQVALYRVPRVQSGADKQETGA